MKSVSIISLVCIISFFCFYENKNDDVILTNDEYKIVYEINQERIKNGFVPLELDERLVIAAREKSKDLLENDYFAHNSLKLGTPKEMVEKKGIIFYKLGGENIAKGKGDIESIVKAWLKSDGHRKNIMLKEYKKTGVGISKDLNGTTYCTQVFIG